MGLDMRPMGKPKPGYEGLYQQLFAILQGTEKQSREFLEKLHRERALSQDELLEHWYAIQIPTYETIGAPQVGRDAAANEWITKMYAQTDQQMTEEEFIKEYEGYYVIELAAEEDGVPIYRAMEQDENVFRGQFLTDCIDLVGKELVQEAWETKLAPATLDYGQRLMAAADAIAKEHGLEYLKTQRIPPDTDEESLESKLHILFSAAKWLIFYGRNGHGYEADY